MINHTPEPSKRNRYDPITVGDVRPDPLDPFFANLDTPGARIVGAALFLLLFVLATNASVASPLMMLVLLACLLFRMTPRERTLTAVPLTFSAVRLGANLAGPFLIWREAMGREAFQTSPLHFDAGTIWLPLFLSAYLFFTSTIASHTSRVVFWYALAVLLSGLIPGQGYIVIFAMLYYTLFFVMLISIIMDLNSQSSAARPLALEPHPAQA